MPDLSLPILALLVTAAFAAGWLDAVGGGGGLIQLPVLLLALPANATVAALGTNKLASSFGTGAAAVTYANRFPVNRRRVALAMLVAFIAAASGASAASRFPAEIFLPLIWVALLLVWIVNLVNPLSRFEVPSHRARLGIPFAAAIIGFYDGLIGPGTGAFLLTVFVYLLGMDFLQASAKAKFINFATNLAAILIFAQLGEIYWALGLMMAVANIAGGQFGARYAIARGGDFVRRVLLVVVAILLVRFGVQIWG